VLNDQYMFHKVYKASYKAHLIWESNMYEYNCKIVKVVDGDSIYVDIDLGLAIGFIMSLYVFMVLILQSAAHEMLKKRLPDSWRRSLSKKRCTSEEHTPSLPKKKESSAGTSERFT
jgi:hypothetical protein